MFLYPIRSFECAFDFWILEYLGGYATKPKRIVLTMGIIVLIFAFIFMIPGILDLGKNSYGPIKAGIYHSLITFLTIGYGDVTPKSWCGIILCGIEGFLGMFLISYFTVAFVRKVLR